MRRTAIRNVRKEFSIGYKEHDAACHDEKQGEILIKPVATSQNRKVVLLTK
jgi:hypothetical protein